VRHRADVPDIEKNFAGLREEKRREFAIVGPGAGDGAFVEGTGFGVEEKRKFWDVGVSAVHADVALGLLLGIVERMGMEKGPDELAADVLESKFEVRVLVDGVMAAEECGSANVQALLVVDFFRVDEAGRVTGAGGGDGRVEGMSESVAESDARRSGLDEFSGISGMEHARLSGHVEEAFYMEERDGARRKDRKNFTQSTQRTQRTRRKATGGGERREAREER